MVERGVELDAVEDSGIERKVVLLPGARRVEASDPVRVRPALRAEADTGAQGRASGDRLASKKPSTRRSYSTRCDFHAPLCPQSGSTQSVSLAPAARHRSCA